MSSIRFSPRPNRAHEIDWKEWDEAAFVQAQAEDKPILLSISAVWCHWCHVMDETSYSDPQVIGLINQRFIPIRVDSDQRPDINSRYNMGGWPTAAFLSPEGDVISGATYMPPEQMRGALEQVSEAYGQRKDAIRQRAHELGNRRRAQASLTSEASEIDESIVDDVSRSVAAAYDPEYGGFGMEPKFPAVSAIELLLHMYQTTGDLQHRLMAEKTLDTMMRGGLHDHEEGGFFRYSTTRDWSVPHFEKMMEGNIGLLRLYLRGHLITGNEEYAEVATGVAGYLNRHLYDAASGAFYGSQDADEGYYALSAAQRRRRSPPAVDPLFYTSLNAMVVSAYLEAGWVLNRPELTDTALRAVQPLLERSVKGGLLRCYSADSDAGIPALLTDFAHLITALVDAYDATLQQRYLDGAQHVAGQMVDIFHDHRSGGFFDIPAGPVSFGNLKLRLKPIGDNVAAVQALTRLFSSTFEQRYRELSESALRVFASTYPDYGESAAGYALAVHRFLHPPVEVTVVGTAGGDDTRALLRGAATARYPHMAVKFVDCKDDDMLAAAGYPSTDLAQAYVCFDSVCLPPVGDPEALRRSVEEFLQAPDNAVGSFLQDIRDLR